MRKPLTSRLTAALLAAALVLGLTACKDKDSHKVNFQTAPAYTAEEIALPVQTGDLLGCCTDGEYMYILADEKVGEEIRTVLCRVNLADGTVKEMQDFQPTTVPDGGGKSVLGPILAPDGTLWLYEMWTLRPAGGF